ncbi:unnamed protein product [Trichogramma brassicae]|uniref:Uncharacterized protein n=1 Tax=Trichogramma brassicae TaxID=86971 RepID=A0A6H5IMT0_9HYME|nr:unnamed protein product [Trichogramma brassicae]
MLVDCIVIRIISCSFDEFIYTRPSSLTSMMNCAYIYYIKCYWDVHYKYCKELEIFYLEAKRKKNEEPSIFIPWPACSYLSLDLISNIQRELKTDK